MAFNETDPTTWTDPNFHPDFGVDSAKSVSMLRECSIAALSTVPGVSVRLIVDADDGVLYCEISASGAELGELYCVESLNDDSLRYGFFSENRDSTKEFEFYTDSIVDVCRIISRVREGDDLESLQEEFGNSM